MVALLACHGAYGFQHQLAEHQPIMAQQMAHGQAQPGLMDAHHPPPKGDDPGQGAIPRGGYFAVLILMFLAAALWSWRGGPWAPKTREARRFTTRTPTPPVPHPPRGPTLYLFQVMRL